MNNTNCQHFSSGPGWLFSCHILWIEGIVQYRCGLTVPSAVCDCRIEFLCNI